MKLIPLPHAPQPAMVHERKDYFTLPQLIDYANAVAEVKLAAANAQIAALRELLEVARNALFGYANSFGARNFTDRYGDADRCNHIVAAIDAARGKK